MPPSFEACSSPMHRLSLHFFIDPLVLLFLLPLCSTCSKATCRRGELKIGNPTEKSIDILGNNSLFVRESLHSFYRSNANLLDMLLKCFLALLNSTSSSILSAGVCLLRSAVPCCQLGAIACRGPLMRNWTVVICRALVTGPCGRSRSMEDAGLLC